MSDLLKFYFSPHQLLSSVRRFVEGWLSVAGAELTVRELLSYWNIEECIRKVLQDTHFIWLLYLLPFMIGFFRFVPKHKVGATIAGTDIRISCKVCDILRQQGDIVISVNTTFDTSTTDDFISPQSLQGAFQTKYYGKGASNVSTLDNEISDALKSLKPVEIIKDGRKTKTKQYAVGTVVKLPKKKRFWSSSFRPYLVAMATSTISGAATTTKEQFAEALQKLWSFLAENGCKTKLCVPLLGTGRSGLNCARMTIAKELIFSFVAYARSFRVVDELQICITPHDCVTYNISLDELQDYLNVVSANDSLYHKSSQTTNSSTPISE